MGATSVIVFVDTGLGIKNRSPLSHQPLVSQTTFLSKPQTMDSSFESYLATLTPEERAEAKAAAQAAKRAEERAEQRAIEKALQEKRQQRAKEALLEKHRPSHSAIVQPKNGLVYIPKNQRLGSKREDAHSPSSLSQSKEETSLEAQLAMKRFNGQRQTIEQGYRMEESKNTVSKPATELSGSERLAIKSTYLGKSSSEEQPKKKKRVATNKKVNFRFRWDETDDTFAADDPLYAPVTVNRSAKRQKQDSLMGLEVANMETVANKPVSAMTMRDWRIFRENYSITVKGGKSPPPMRSFRESPSSIIPPLHPTLLDAIENVLRFQDPSPIQRQAIPIGLQRRDLIGIAETGSGKTVAFGVPLCQYLLQLSSDVLQSVAVQGPLALVLAPTRELAQQIDAEFQKLLSCQRVIRSYVVVGGQPIQNQAQEIRRGIHILVGTPGRINDCIKMSYLVLNQCCYVIMDEADRMIDMGFAPQIESM